MTTFNALLEKRPCRHDGCRRLSANGIWCRSCIEWEWPYLAVGDGRHWLVNKLTWRKDENLYIGSFGAPYEVGEYTIPFGPSWWLASPLGTLKEAISGRNTDQWQSHLEGLYVITAVVRAESMMLIDNLTLCGLSACLTVAARPIADLQLLPKQADALLADVEKNFALITEWERRLRPSPPEKIALPPDFAGDAIGNRRSRMTILRQLLKEHNGVGSAILIHAPSPALRATSLRVTAAQLRRLRQKTVAACRRYQFSSLPPSA